VTPSMMTTRRVALAAGRAALVRSRSALSLVSTRQLPAIGTTRDCRFSFSTDSLPSPPARDESQPGQDEFEMGIHKLDDGRLSAAVDDFAQAASLGSPDGNFYLALAYDGLLGRDARDEFPVEPDEEAAARCYSRAASAGHEMAMLNLSFCYRKGQGVAVDVAEAWKWLSMSATAGSDRAQFNAGLALDPLHPPYGTAGVDMVAKDPEGAVFFYRKAVAQGHEKAKVNLGVSLYTGTGVPKDPAAAKELWLEALEAGVPEAEFCLKNMEEQPGKFEKLFE